MSEVKNVWLRVDGKIYGWDKDTLCAHFQELIDGLNNSPFPVISVVWEEAKGGFNLYGFQVDPIPSEAIVYVNRKDNSDD